VQGGKKFILRRGKRLVGKIARREGGRRIL